jgi:hypothetical protein
MSKNVTESFAEYDKADAVVRQCREALEEAMKQRTKVVDQIVADFGSGPFDIEGKWIQAVTRKIKDDDDVVIGHTTFFKAARTKKPKPEKVPVKVR